MDAKSGKDFLWSRSGLLQQIPPGLLQFSRRFSKNHPAGLGNLRIIGVLAVQELLNQPHGVSAASCRLENVLNHTIHNLFPFPAGFSAVSLAGAFAGVNS